MSACTVRLQRELQKANSRSANTKTTQQTTQLSSACARVWALTLAQRPVVAGISCGMQQPSPSLLPQPPPLPAPPPAKFANATVIHANFTQPKCGLILFVHVPKTGGQTLTQVLESVPMWEDYGRPSMFPQFLLLHSSLFAKDEQFWHLMHRYYNTSIPHYCTSLNASSLEANARCLCVTKSKCRDWRTRRFYVDIHDISSHQAFGSLMRPRLAELRKRYFDAGCVFKMATIVRDPKAATLSFFQHLHMVYHRVLWHKQWRQVLAFDEWLAGNNTIAYTNETRRPKDNMQLAYLTQPEHSCRKLHVYGLGPYTCAMPPTDVDSTDVERLCSTTTSNVDAGAAAVSMRQMASNVLDEFDLVGTTDSVLQLLGAVLSYMGLEANGELEAEAAGFRCNTQSSHANMGAMLSLPTLSSSTSERLHRMTRCDDALFEEAQRRKPDVARRQCSGSAPIRYALYFKCEAYRGDMAYSTWVKLHEEPGGLHAGCAPQHAALELD